MSEISPYTQKNPVHYRQSLSDQAIDDMFDLTPPNTQENSDGDPFADLRHGYEGPNKPPRRIPKIIGATILATAISVVALSNGLIPSSRGSAEETPAENTDKIEYAIPPTTVAPSEQDLSPDTRIPIILQPEIIRYDKEGPIVQDVDWIGMFSGDNPEDIYTREMLNGAEKTPELNSANIRLIAKEDSTVHIGTAGLIELNNGEIALLSVQHVTDGYSNDMYAMIPGLGTIDLSDQLGKIDNTDLTDYSGSAAELYNGDSTSVINLNEDQQNIIKKLIIHGDLMTFKISPTPSQEGDKLYILNGRTGKTIKLLQTDTYEDSQNELEYSRDGQSVDTVINGLTDELLKDGIFNSQDKAVLSNTIFSLDDKDKTIIQSGEDAFICEGQSGSGIFNENGKIVGVVSGAHKTTNNGLNTVSFRQGDLTCTALIVASNA